MGEKMRKSDVFIGILCAVVCEVLYGFSYIFTKNLTNVVTPMELLCWRFITAAIVLNICCALKLIKIDLRGKNLKSLFLIAVFQPALYFTCETIGISLTTASESGTIIACIPVVTLICSTLILKEKPNRWQVMGITMTLVGVIGIVLMQEVEASLNVGGYIILFMGVTSYALYSVFAQKEKSFSDMEKTYIMIMTGAILFPLVAIIENGINHEIRALVTLPFTNINILVAILYLGVGSSVVAFLLSNVAISKIGTNRVSTFIGLSTIISVLAGVIILDESFSKYQIIGTVLIMIGVYIANKKHECEVEEGEVEYERNNRETEEIL